MDILHQLTLPSLPKPWAQTLPLPGPEVTALK